jgi:hypothetical protein
MASTRGKLKPPTGSHNPSAIGGTNAGPTAMDKVRFVALKCNVCFPTFVPDADPTPLLPPPQVAKNRPQLLDPYGRNLTPRALLPTHTGAAPEHPLAPALGSSQWGSRPVTRDSHVTSDTAAGDFPAGDGGPSDGLSIGGGDEAAAVGGSEGGGGGGAPTALGASSSSGARPPGSAARVTGLSEAALETMVTICLTETATVTVLSVPSTRSLADTPEARGVAAANDAYEAALVQIARYRNEMYPSRGVGAPSPATRDKECAAVPPAQTGGGAQATAWDLADTRRAAAAGKVPYGALSAGGDEEEKGGVEALEAVVAAIVTVSLSVPGALIDADAGVALLPEGGEGGPPLERRKRGGAAPGASATAAGGGGAAPGASATAAGPVAAAAAAPGVRHGSTAASVSESGVSGGGWGRLGDSAATAVSRFGVARSDEGSAGVGGGGRGVQGGGGACAAAGASAGAAPAAGGGGGDDAGGESVDPLLAQEFDALVKNPELQRTLALVERAALQNNYAESLKLYRAGPSIDLTTRLLAAGAHPVHGYEGAAAVLSAGSGGGTGDAAGAKAAPGEESEGEGEGSSRPGSSGDGNADPPATPARGAAAGGEGKPVVDVGSVDVSGAPRSALAAESPVPAAAAAAAAYAAAAAAAPSAPSLSLLWSYFCPMLRGYSVSAMAWCEAPGTSDLLAVGYGPTDFGSTPDTGSRGLVCLWTLANPTTPVAILRTPENVGVSSIAFSRVAPRLLAVGCYDGGLCVYDAGDALAASLSAPAPPVALSERLAPGSHSEPVWGLQWVPRPESPGGQVLVSISTDGRVTEWTTKKRILLPRQLMKLRRGGGGGGGTAAGGGGGSGGSGAAGLLARSAPGLSLEFVFEPPPPAGEGSPPPQPRDGAPTPYYWVGTEEGTLARCSTLYSEQYMDTVAAHSGPINRVRLSPFSHAAVLTASSDWSVKLWNTAKLGGVGATPPCLCFNTDGTRDSVADVAWSPTISTRFASVTRDGHVQVRPRPTRAAALAVFPYPTHRARKTLTLAGVGRGVHRPCAAHRRHHMHGIVRVDSTARREGAPLYPPPPPPHTHTP